MNAYRALLRLAPARLRARHGAAMEAFFRTRLEEARQRGAPAVATVWIAAIADVLWARARQPVAWLRSRDRIGQPSSRSPIMLGSDVRYAIRSLARQKLGSGLVVAMLAVGIAANVAVFSLVNGLFLRPFPYPEPDRLAFINERAPKWNLEMTGINFPDFAQWRQGQREFSAIAIMVRSTFNLASDGNAERVLGLVATYEIADVLGIRPAIGRMFTAEEDRPGGPNVVVLGHGLWREQFGGSPDVLGRTLRLSGRAYEIIGVLPQHADIYPGETRFWVPLQGDPASTDTNYRYDGLGRLRPGVTVQQAEADLTRAHQPIWDTRDKERIVSPFAVDLREHAVRDYRPIASTLALAVGLLLLIASANVAALMLARALARRREMGIRLAVGASRLRVLRQLFLENLVLALVGGALGLLLGHLAIEALIAALPDQAPPWARFALDGRVIAFALGVSALTVLLFGWAPAMHAMRSDLRSAMHSVASGTTASPGGRRTLWALVGVEFALAALMLVCGGLLWRAYDRVRHLDPGFNANGVLAFTASLPQAVYADDAKRLAFWDRTLDRLSSLPGVAHAALVTCPPLGCHRGTLFQAEGQLPRRPDDVNPVVLLRFASSDYLQTMGIKLESGRFIEPRDGRSGPDGENVVVINDIFARTFFPDIADPVGRRVRPGTSEDASWATVIGVVEDPRHYGLEQPMRPGVYYPVPVSPAPTLTAVAKTTGVPSAIARSVRAMMRELDPELPLFNVRTMEDALRRSMAIRTVYSWMLAVFACMAVVLALGGTYGVTSYLVTQRLREIGIRVALGARRGDIVRSVLKGSLAVVGAGIVLGLLASVPVAGMLSGLLFGVSPTDVVIIAGAAAVLITTALLANVIPARRAAGVDPMISLRTE